jgi:TRAP-type mannitol/chloroaromatic compound transport system permease small subunit
LVDVAADGFDAATLVRFTTAVVFFAVPVSVAVVSLGLSFVMISIFVKDASSRPSGRLPRFPRAYF